MKPLKECPACGEEAESAKETVRDTVVHGVDRLVCSLVRCQDCGHVFMNPQPSAAELAPFYDASYHVFDETPMSSDDVDDLIATRFDGTRLGHSAFFEAGKFLDVGCGLGDMVAAMQRLGMNACGIDPSSHAVRVAVAAGRRVEQGNLAERAFPDAEFDSISMYHSLEHTPDPLSVLRECARILSPRGELMVAVPNIEALNARLFGRQWSHLSLPHHLQHFTGATLRRVAYRAGLHCTRMVTESLVWSVEQELCRWSRRNLLIPYRASERLHVFRPVAAILAHRADDSDRGDAIVAYFRIGAELPEPGPASESEPRSRAQL